MRRVRAQLLRQLAARLECAVVDGLEDVPVRVRARVRVRVRVRVRLRLRLRVRLRLRLRIRLRLRLRVTSLLALVAHDRAAPRVARGVTPLHVRVRLHHVHRAVGRVERERHLLRVTGLGFRG